MKFRTHEPKGISQGQDFIRIRDDRLILSKSFWKTHLSSCEALRVNVAADQDFYILAFEACTPSSEKSILLGKTATKYLRESASSILQFLNGMNEKFTDVVTVEVPFCGKVPAVRIPTDRVEVSK